MMNQAALVELIYKTLPDSNTITDLNLDQVDVVRFNWKGKRYRVTTTLFVEELVESFCKSSKDANYVSEILNNNYY